MRSPCRSNSSASALASPTRSASASSCSSRPVAMTSSSGPTPLHVRSDRRVPAGSGRVGVATGAGDDALDDLGLRVGVVLHLLPRATGQLPLGRRIDLALLW